MKITNGKGKKQEVKRGLVDSDGAFFLLVDDNETRYYRFSSENGLINTLIDQSDKLRKEKAQLKKKVESLKKDVHALETYNEKLTIESVKLQRANDGS